MTIKDFFYFRDEEYEERIKDKDKYSDDRINKERTKRTRQQYDGCWSIGKGVVCCIVNCDLQAVMLVCACRRRAVSKRKLKLLEKEADRRGIKKSESEKRHCCISCLSNSGADCIDSSVGLFIPCVGGCIAKGFRMCCTKMLTKVIKTSDRPSKAGAQAKQPNTRVQGQDGASHGLENVVSEPHALEKGADRTGAPVPGLQDVVQTTDRPSETGVQTKQPNTPPNTRVQGQDGASHSLENDVSEPHAAVHPPSDR